jgi:nucleoside 2-deoxyribosyltransferase
LNKNQEYEGAAIDLKKLGDHDLLITKLYFLNHNEYWFYLNTLKEQNFLNFQEVASNYGTDAFQIKFTYKGLEHVIDLLESGENSKYCFIAMSFSKSAENIRSAIKKVLHETSFEPILVDELHYESDLTINDAIIMNIRKSKFLIADFTEQKHGVYFEAGFALGLKRPVIYTCSEEDFNKTHFDTNHYPHIVYTTMPDLERKLKDKIEAWIE